MDHRDLMDWAGLDLIEPWSSPWLSIGVLAAAIHNAGFGATRPISAGEAIPWLREGVKVETSDEAIKAEDRRNREIMGGITAAWQARRE